MWGPSPRYLSRINEREESGVCGTPTRLLLSREHANDCQGICCQSHRLWQEVDTRFRLQMLPCRLLPRGRRDPLNNRQVHALFSSYFQKQGYENTRQNLKVGSHTRVIYQGFTGRQATANARQSIEYGTNVVGGVTPGKTAEHLGLPVLPSVRAAKDQLRPDATAIFVAAPHAASAIEEAIEAEIPLIVAVAEHIPLHDILRVGATFPQCSARY